MRPGPETVGVLHFIGIGGIGMSGIAEILNNLGYTVQGSDLTENYNLDRLRKNGIRVQVGHKAEHLKTTTGEWPNVVVMSSAVKKDNPELVAARELKIPIVRRADMLAEIMRLRSAIAIGGTHGKTTTTSMVGAMLEAGNLDPMVINGGIVNAYGTNTRQGEGEWMVVEADESDGTFTKLPATVAVVTNIDPEHMDHYDSFDDVREAYRDFVENIPFYGFAVLCTDHPVVQGLVSELFDRKVITYGMNAQADVRGTNLRPTPDGYTYDVIISERLTGKKPLVLKDLFLPMVGEHNVQNSLAAVAVGFELDMTPMAMQKALRTFNGVKRRFTKTGISNGITVIDDYGHHPVEIAAVLKAARQAVQVTGGKVIAVAQPHRYSRLSSLFEGFCTCFNEADTVVIADVYAAGETPIAGFTKETLAAGIKNHGHHDVHILPHADALAELIKSIAQPQDYVICLGAGSITYWANALPAELDALYNVKEASNG